MALEDTALMLVNAGKIVGRSTYANRLRLPEVGDVVAFADYRTVVEQPGLAEAIAAGEVGPTHSVTLPTPWTVVARRFVYFKDGVVNVYFDVEPVAPEKTREKTATTRRADAVA
jgi:hypothetical protein